MSSRWQVSGRLIAALFALYQTPAMADYGLNMPQGATEISHAVHSLHMTIFWVCVAIGILVYSVMIYSIIRHRKAAGFKPATFHESTTVEIIWTVIPFIILVVMAIPATKTLILMHDTRNADVTIKITGYRWHWHYDYLDEGISFFSYISTPDSEIANMAPKNPHYLLEVDKPIAIPVGKKVRFLITAKDVIHSWWVPDFAIKKDAIPGFINEVWTKVEPKHAGKTFRGQCAELCGAKHGYMPIVVIAKNENDYQAWLNEHKKTQAATSLHNHTAIESQKS